MERQTVAWRLLHACRARAAGWATRRRVEAAGLSVVLASTMTLPIQAALNADVASDANWIMSARLPDGAIANYVDRQAVWPYLSNFAAMGLARATAVTGNASYVAAAWTWLSWYQAHQNAQGFVTDYTVTNGVLTSTNDMDSTDSYAGTFLLATREAYRVTNDLTKLKGVATGVANAVRAIEATQDTDGLTWAKPTWHVKYLMDQGETYAGLLAAFEIANALKDSALAQRVAADAARMKTGVDALWNAGTLGYDWAVHDTGARTPANWSILYPDSLQQAWAVAFGLVDNTRAPALLAKFNTAQPSWRLPSATATFASGPGIVGYWPVAGWAFVAIKDPLAATAPADIRTAALAANRAWPFTTGNAGQLILFESGFSLGLAAATPSAARPKTPTPTTVLPRKTGGTTGSSLPVLVPTTRPPATTTTAKPTPTTAKPTTTTSPPLVTVPVPGGPTVTVPKP